jgi:hypothetical protein
MSIGSIVNIVNDAILLDLETDRYNEQSMVCHAHA